MNLKSERVKRREVRVRISNLIGDISENISFYDHELLEAKSERCQPPATTALIKPAATDRSFCSPSELFAPINFFLFNEVTLRLHRIHSIFVHVVRRKVDVWKIEISLPGSERKQRRFIWQNYQRYDPAESPSKTHHRHGREVTNSFSRLILSKSSDIPLLRASITTR